MKKSIFPILAALIWLAGASLQAGTTVQDMGKPGTKTVIDKGVQLTYSFNAHLAMGTVILKIKVTDSKGNPVEGYSLTGVYDMPEMNDSNSGKVAFVQNKKKDFLLPINVTMPGKWEVTVTVKKGRKTLITGLIDFNV